MASFQRDINPQPANATPVVSGTLVGNQIAYDTYFDTSGGLYVGTSGNLSVILAGDSTNTIVTYYNIPNGTFLPIQAKYISSTSTCSNIIVFLNGTVSAPNPYIWDTYASLWEAANVNWN